MYYNNKIIKVKIGILNLVELILYTILIVIDPVSGILNVMIKCCDLKKEECMKKNNNNGPSKL